MPLVGPDAVRAAMLSPEVKAAITAQVQAAMTQNSAPQDQKIGSGGIGVQIGNLKDGGLVLLGLAVLLYWFKNHRMWKVARKSGLAGSLDRALHAKKRKSEDNK